MKLTRYEPADSKPSRQARASEIAREKAIERALSAYMHLACGCLSTWEEQLVFEVFREYKNTYYCERHGWVEMAPKPEKIIYPAEPLF